MPTIHVNDIEMYYGIRGESEPLALILGLGTDISEWDGIIRWLAQRFRVIAFDSRGAGRSDKPDRPYAIEMMAGDTEGLLRAVAIERAHIVGISLGGRIALALALEHPERINKLVLVSTSARSARRHWWFRLLSLLSSGPFFRSKYPQPRYAFHRQRQASPAFNCTDRLREIHAPTLILHGKRDKSVPYALAEEVHAGIAGSQMLSFEGGHIFFLFRERQRFLDVIAEFLGG
ncbi:MAG: alpha/beta fold hydrolase [Ktedonobacterales bacterium]